MTINLEEKWQRLRQRARDFWADFRDEDIGQAESGKDPLPAATGRPHYAEDFSRAPLQCRQEAAPDPAAAAHAYRSKPDPAFGSRSAAQRRADEQEQRAREREAMAAARHSQQRHEAYEQHSHGGHPATRSGPDKHQAPGRH